MNLKRTLRGSIRTSVRAIRAIRVVTSIRATNLRRSDARARVTGRVIRAIVSENMLMLGRDGARDRST